MTTPSSDSHTGHSVQSSIWRLSFSLILFTLSGTRAWAQATTVTFNPPAPTAYELISAQIDFISVDCNFTPSTVVTGTTIQTTISYTDCLVGPPGTFPRSVSATFGPLPAGTYNYDVYFKFGTATPVFSSRQQLAVAPAPAAIPALSRTSLLALALALAALAMIGLYRFGSFG